MIGPLRPRSPLLPVALVLRLWDQLVLWLDSRLARRVTRAPAVIDKTSRSNDRQTGVAATTLRPLGQARCCRSRTASAEASLNQPPVVVAVGGHYHRSGAPNTESQVRSISGTPITRSGQDPREIRRHSWSAAACHRYDPRPASPLRGSPHIRYTDRDCPTAIRECSGRRDTRLDPPPSAS